MKKKLIFFNLSGNTQYNFRDEPVLCSHTSPWHDQLLPCSVSGGRFQVWLEKDRKLIFRETSPLSVFVMMSFLLVLNSCAVSKASISLFLCTDSLLMVFSFLVMSRLSLTILTVKPQFFYSNHK